MKKSQIRTVWFLFAGLMTITVYQNCSSVKFDDVPSAEVPNFAAAIDKTCALGKKIAIPLADLELHCSNYDTPETANIAWLENGIAKYIFPKKTNVVKTVPDSCLQGFEVGNLNSESFTFETYERAGTKQNLALEVDLATYAYPDGSRIIAKDALGNETIVFDSCNIRTSCYGDPTNGDKRAYEDSIRSFNIEVPKGTVTLTLDHSTAITPTYVRILGICEFDLSHLPATKSTFSAGQVRKFNLVQSRAVSTMGVVSPHSIYQY